MAKKTKATEVQVKREVRRLEDRTSGLESLMRFLHRAQVDQLAKAEKLRKLVLAMLESRHNASRVRSYIRANDALEAFVETLGPFHDPKGRDPYKAWERKQAREMAERIARHLFTDALGEQARRLVREKPGGEKFGSAGWSERSMADRIEDLLLGKVE